jgi:uncharacterized SAM-binding protein YcdF (DUF218 family)
VVLRRGPVLKTLLAILLVGVVLSLTPSLWLPIVGRILVYDDGPGQADIAVVLAGDHSGARIIGAAELARRGYVPAVLVSGPPGFYGIDEADAAIRFIVAKGYPAEWFIPLKHGGMSTYEEAQFVMDELARRKVRSFILVTSNFHTRRARRIYLAAERRRGGGPAMRVVSIPDKDYDPVDWWRTRQGWKTAFLEWTKLVTGMLGI